MHWVGLNLLYWLLLIVFKMTTLECHSVFIRIHLLLEHTWPTILLVMTQVTSLSFFTFMNCSLGSVYLFNSVDSQWSQFSKLIALDGSIKDQFGCSVSVYGNYLLVGSFQDDDKGDYSGC